MKNNNKYGRYCTGLWLYTWHEMVALLECDAGFTGFEKKNIFNGQGLLDLWRWDFGN